MWNDPELQHDVENEVYWELGAGLTGIGVRVKPLSSAELAIDLAIERKTNQRQAFHQIQGLYCGTCRGQVLESAERVDDFRAQD